MRFLVRSGKSEGAFSIDFAEVFHTKLIGEWEDAKSAIESGAQQDTMEFLESAVAKWSLYNRKDRIARSMEDLLARVKRDKNVDVLCVLTASADWYRGGTLTGFCQFRRTWSNNVVFDFLGVHPHVIATREISGVGTALLAGLACVVRELNAGFVWAETTDISVTYYERLFKLATRSDLLLLEAGRFYESLAPLIAKRPE